MLGYWILRFCCFFGGGFSLTITGYVGMFYIPMDCKVAFNLDDDAEAGFG